jgi:spermidine dehydrogenase
MIICGAFSWLPYSTGTNFLSKNQTSTAKLWRPASSTVCWARATRDIAAITVNRWPHGYAYSADSLFDAEISGPQPYEIARRRCGNVTIGVSAAEISARGDKRPSCEHAIHAVGELRPPTG